MTRPRLLKEIGAALAFKALALAALYLAFFSGPHKASITPLEMSTFLIGNHSTPR